MAYRIVADENIDHRIVHRLEHYGHDVEHVDYADALGKGTDDATIAAYSTARDRLILSNDDDFLREFDSDDYRGLLFIEDDSLSGTAVADIVHAMAGSVGHEQANGVLYVSTNWL